MKPKVILNEENFLDSNFRKALATWLRISDGDEITYAMIQQTTELDVSRSRISTLNGVEHFTALKKLYCSSNQLTSLDVSQNTALTMLWCHNNQLSSLDVSKNIALRGLWCNNNQLTALDVSKNTKLELLSCTNNQLTKLDLLNNTALTGLNCYGNHLTYFDLTEQKNLLFVIIDSDTIVDRQRNFNKDLRIIRRYR